MDSPALIQSAQDGAVLTLNRPGACNALSAALTAMLYASVPNAAYADDPAPVISNFKFRLICGTADNRRVCFQTDTIQVTDESRCVYGPAPISCTWYGYSFDYESSADLEINCQDSTDTPVNIGNPREAGTSPITSFDYVLDLKQGRHHFFLSKYIAGEKSEKSLQHGKETCSFKGAPLFTNEFQYEFAEKTLPIVSVPDANNGR